MDEVLQITIRLIYNEYCRALGMWYAPQRRHELMSLMLYRAEEIGYDDYARGNNQVPYFFDSRVELRDAWLMGFAAAGIRDSVNQLRQSPLPCQADCEAELQGR